MVYYFTFIAIVIFIIFLLKLVKKNKLDEKYSILWLIFSIIILIASLFPSIINYAAKLFNVYYPPSLVFLLGYMILAFYIVHITIVITKQNKMIINLTQEIGILKTEKLNSEGKKGVNDGRS